ncbi:nicotinate phosphoribosyltransferase [Aquibaculum sediminis]|uniref:nicotinate phosphoribosyltransferase n=1 Tax=Aquibaculum sediminis TaxID=3231907 RepID=UPI00345358F1
MPPSPSHEPRPVSAVGHGNALFTDLYELTMLQAYLAEGMQEPAVFTLTVRRLPPRRNFLLACGLEQVLDYLEALRFTSDDLAYLRSLGHFCDAFLVWLAAFRFTGEVRAVPEGTPVFGGEPILEVRAPLPQAQLIETFVLNQIHLQTLLASKAARVVSAAQGRPVIDFGARRMHGLDAATMAARAFHIAGLAATSNVAAGQRFGLPLAGTMAHSYIQAHDREASAFEAFAQVYPDSVLLVDTYDTLEGVQRVIALAREQGKTFRVRAIRLDSGDLGALARDARALLDAAGLQRVEIIASGGLDETKIAALLAEGAPIDGFGVGTAMGVSDDAPSLDIAYKLCAYAGRGRLKLSPGKLVLPGPKQVFRRDAEGSAEGDTIALQDERLPGRPLLVPVMHDGRRLAAGGETLSRIRARARDEIAALPTHLHSLKPADPPYPVAVSEVLQGFADQTAAWVAGTL